MAVNVSPVTAERPDLLALLAGCHVDHVVLEVTEHARVDDYPRFRVAIARVRELGASLAVDDAGAGFASLRHILELDAELIKLDGSLTHSLEADPRRRSLAAALIEFGRESGASVLAEHVESELQLVELRRLGVRVRPGLPPGPSGPAARAGGALRRGRVALLARGALAAAVPAAAATSAAVAAEAAAGIHARVDAVEGVEGVEGVKGVESRTQSKLSPPVSPNPPASPPEAWSPPSSTFFPIRSNSG